MSSRKTRNRHKPRGRTSPATFHGSVLQSIRQHARGTPQMEICGALIGRQSDAGTFVIGAVPGEGAAQGSTHVTFTQEAWVRIHEEKDKRYPGQAIVGWYHSHPGFGVFLSDHDVFIHKNFFANPGSLAWVYDPHSDEEGCFAWNGGEVRRLVRFEVVTDADKRIRPGREPVGRTHSHRPDSPARLALWRSPKTSRPYFMIALTALLALLVGLGWFALSHTVLPERVTDWLMQRKFTRPVERAPTGSPARERESDAGKTRLDGAVSHDTLPRNGKDDLKRDGGHDEY